MGNSASRAVRKLPKRAEPPSWTSNKAPNPMSRPNGVKREQARDKLASEHKTEAIKQDAFDPHFLANIQKLGPVRVDHHMQTVQPDAAATGTAELFKARNMAQQQQDTTTSPSDTTTHLRFYASQLSAAFNTRKGVSTKDEMRKLAEASQIQFDKLESVAKFVNTPSVSKGSVRTTIDKDGNETTIARAVWIEPPYVDLPEVNTSSPRSS